MTVTNQNCRWRYTGDGATTAFPYGNVIYAAGDLQVYVAGTRVMTGFEITGLGGADGGSVTFDVAPPNATDVLLVSAVAAVQPLQYSAGTPFPSAVTGTALDRLTRLVQQLVTGLGRALQINVTDPDDITVDLPPAAVRAGKILSFDSGGNLAVTSSIPTAAVSSAMAPVIESASLVLATEMMGVVQALSPMQFGAAGDGVTDDAAAIVAMMAVAFTRAAAGKNCVIDGGNFTFATSQPWAFPSNTTVRNVRTVALVSSAWVGRQIPADTTTNGLFYFAPGTISVYCENCVLDCQGIQGGGSQTDKVLHCNGFTISNGCVNIHLSRCFARNPSEHNALLYSIGDVQCENCAFTCVDTSNVATYTGYPAFFDWYYNSANGQDGAMDSRLMACNFQNGIFQIYISPGCSQLFFSAGSHWFTAGGGANGRIGVQCYGHGIRFQDCYHDSDIQYVTGGQYTNAAGLNTQIDVDLQVCDGKIGTDPATPSLYLNSQVANSTMNRLKWTHGLHYQGNTAAPLINVATSAGGTWALPAEYLTILGTVEDDIITTSNGLSVFAPAGLQAVTGYSTDTHYAGASFAALGRTPAYASNPFFGAYQDDGVMVSADGNVTLRVCSANSDAGATTAFLIDTTTSGTRLGFRQAWTNNDPNNTTSTYAQFSSQGTARFKVFSNGNVVNTNNSYGVISDARTKTDIIDAPAASDRLAGLRVAEFNSLFDPTGPRLTGLIAQEVQALFPDMVAEDGTQLIADDGTLVPVGDDGLPTGPGSPVLFVNISQLLPFLLLGWQEERAARLALETRVAALEAPAP